MDLHSITSAYFIHQFQVLSKLPLKSQSWCQILLSKVINKVSEILRWNVNQSQILTVDDQPQPYLYEVEVGHQTCFCQLSRMSQM